MGLPKNYCVMRVYKMGKIIGFLVNPIAGMGGSVGLKGTDGGAYLRALKLGAKPVAPQRAKRFLERAARKELDVKADFIIAPHVMGEDYARGLLKRYKVIGNVSSKQTTSKDTKNVVRDFINYGADLIVFVGGDGTARDIVDVIDMRKPILGVPSGVKMYSSVFAVNPEAAADIIEEFIEGHTVLNEGEVLDIDEESFRKDELKIRLFGYALVPSIMNLVQAGKEPTPTVEDEIENQRAIAKYVIENLEPETLYILGPGTTVKAITDELGLPKTVLGVDLLFNGKIIARDVNEKQILEFLERFPKAKIIVTPIGGQGFIFGRGNQQITPRVIRKVGRKNIIVIATRRKLSKIRELRVDTGDPKLDEALRGYIKVIVDYNEEVVTRII